jgi:hypothetical protein
MNSYGYLYSIIAFLFLIILSAAMWIYLNWSWVILGVIQVLGLLGYGYFVLKPNEKS